MAQNLNSIVKKEDAHDDEIWTVCWRHNEYLEKDFIVTGGVDEFVKCWLWDDSQEQSDLKLVHTFKGHELAILSVDIDPLGKIAASSSLDSCIKLWDLQVGKLRKNIDAGPVDVWSLIFSPDGQFIITGSQTGMVNIFSIDSGLKIKTLETGDKFVLSVAYSPDGYTIATGSVNGVVSFIDVSAGKLSYSFEAHSKPIRSLAFSKDSRYLVTASDDTRMKIYDAKATPPTLISTLSGHDSWVVSVAFSPDNMHFASSFSDHKVRIWNVGAKQCVHTFSEHTDIVWGVTYNEEGNKLASVSNDKSIIVYEIQ